MWNKAIFNTVKGTWPIACAIACIWLIGHALQIQATEQPPSPPSVDSEFVMQGKIFCSLKRYVLMPFKGSLLSVPVHSGQTVKKGDILAKYQLVREEMMQLRRRISPLRINELEVQMAEMEARLASLNNRETELDQLSLHKMASEAALRQIAQEKQLALHHKALLQERLRLERQVIKEERDLVGKLLGNSIQHETVPEIVSIVSPIDGVVVGIHPELREGAETGPISPAFIIGVLNPMIVRAQVHEIETIQLSLGDRAEISPESLPGKKFNATVSRISLTPLSPALEQPSYYEIELTVSSPDHVLKDGLKCQIRFDRSMRTQKQATQ
jgi:multidrug efflux pump subunit AcrA (membrane-fusion protein)